MKDSAAEQRMQRQLEQRRREEAFSHLLHEGPVAARERRKRSAMAVNADQLRDRSRSRPTQPPN